MNSIKGILLLISSLYVFPTTAQDTNWVKLDCGPFTVQTPAGWKLVLKAPKDSYRGYITNGNDSLYFDYGYGKGGRLVAFLSKVSMKREGAKIIEKVHQNGYIAHLYSRLNPDGYRSSLFIEYTRLWGRRGSAWMESENLSEANRDIFINIYRSLVFKDPAEFFRLEKDR